MSNFSTPFFSLIFGSAIGLLLSGVQGILWLFEKFTYSPDTILLDILVLGVAIGSIGFSNGLNCLSNKILGGISEAMLKISLTFTMLMMAMMAFAYGLAIDDPTLVTSKINLVAGGGVFIVFLSSFVAEYIYISNTFPKK